MGKGGTRFVAEAIGHRSARSRSTYTNKELKKDMDKYLETGVHPALENSASGSSEVLPLPERDPNRPHVFLELTYRGQAIGKVVIELFEDVLPTTTALFRNRCSYGSSQWLKGTKIHKVQSGYAIFGGADSRAKGSSHGMRKSRRLRHASFGAVSLAVDGSDFAISLGRSLKLDDTHQVIGRVHIGREALDKLDSVPTESVDDSPMSPVIISRCGACDSQGTYDSFEDAGTSDKKLSQKETEELLETEAEATKESVRDAVLSGLTKRKAGPSAGGSSAPAKLARGMMGGVLGDLSDSSDSASDDAE